MKNVTDKLLQIRYVAFHFTDSSFSLFFSCIEINECPKNSDKCLQESPNWGISWNCDRAFEFDNGIYCSTDSWAKDLRRCCPNSCGTGVLTESGCNALGNAFGTCIYPNAAQC